MKYAPETAVMELAPFVARVQEKLGEVLSGEGSIEEILAYIQQTNGKMIRPILLSLVYEMCGGTDSSVVLDVAAGIELIHIASLIHDDIVDQSDLGETLSRAKGVLAHRLQCWRVITCLPRHLCC